MPLGRGLAGLSFVLAQLFTSAAAQVPTHYDEPGLTAGRQYIKHHFAEHIDPFTGHLSLQQVDLFLPGNAGFDLKIQRSYNSNATTGQTASPFGRGWDIHFGRVKHKLNEACATASFQSMRLELPDGSGHTLHRSNGAGNTSTSDYLTPSYWKGVCSSTGITVYAPDGTKYDMSEADGIYWHATRITDKWGNSFLITYETSAAFGRKVVKQVTSSDQRSVTFTYASGKLQSISGEGATWGYTIGVGADGANELDRVTPPRTDGGVWTYNYKSNLGPSAGSYLMDRVTNPFGGSITYTYKFANFLSVLGVPPSTVVATKTAESKTWNYDYDPSCSGSAYDRTTVTLPDGIGQIKYEHFGYCTVGAGSIWKIGLLHQKETGSEETETLEWASQAISDEDANRLGYQKDDPQILRPLLSQRQIARDGVTYTTSYSNFDEHGNPRAVSESAGSNSRSKTFTYFNHTANWIVGLVDDESVSGVGGIDRDRGFNLGELRSETVYGVRTTFDYNSDGTLLRQTTAKPATTTFSGYKRGIAQSETRPDGITITRTVDDRGNIVVQSDGESTWQYQYDYIGRLEYIDFPKGADADVTWTTTRRNLGRGSYSDVTDFDPFGRPIAITRGGVGRTFRYDALGRKTFESMPGLGTGSTITFDILGRPRTITTPGYVRTYTYPNGNVQVVNERGKTTTYSYQRFGNPDEGHLVGIDTSVAGADVQIDRNKIGVINFVKQDNVTRLYHRDTSFFLTGITQPEGNITFGRDGVGNMISRTSGNGTVNYNVDGLNRVYFIHGAGVPSTTIDYDGRSKVKSVSNSVASRAYRYDGNGNLEEDKLVIDGRTFIVGYAYDLIDGLSGITYPEGKGTVTYGPDHLGRPTQASPYLDRIEHYQSGNLQSITFRNGVVQSYGEDGRQLPDSINASGIQLGLKYYYDGTGNVDLIADSYNSISKLSRDLGYDDIDRLVSASGPWGASSLIEYYGNGNIKKQTLGTYTIDYTYQSNRLATLTGSVSRTYGYDAAGNVASYGGMTFTFDPQNQLECVNCNTASEIRYQYDGQGRRISETVAGKKTYFVQAPNGDLQYEYRPYGEVWVKHVYLHGKRVASKSGSDAPETTTTVTASTSTPAIGQAVTFTANVSPSGATGTVEFIEGDRSLGTVNLTSGQASLIVSDLDIGLKVITANYSGAAAYQASSGSKTVTVGPRASSTSLASSASSVALGGAVNLTATVTGSGPTGNVEFRNAAGIVGATALNGSGLATYSYQPTSVGTHDLTARYQGDVRHLESTSSAIPLTVTKGTPTVSLILSNPSRPFGEVVTLQVVVSGVATLPPTGTVTFMEGTIALGSVSVAGGGVFSRNFNYWTPGAHVITAVYSGDANYNSGASPPQTQLITGSPSVVRSVPPQLLGEPEE